MSLPDTTTLFAEVRALLHAARDAAARQVNTLLVLTNFEIGRRIVEHEQGGRHEQRTARECFSRCRHSSPMSSGEASRWTT